MKKGFGNAKPEKLSYTEFIEQILRVVSSSKNNKKKVDSLLKDNLHLLDEKFLGVFKQLVEVKLSKSITQEVANIAASINDFCALLQDFTLDETGTNLEIAIAGYKILLTTYTHQHRTEDWIRTQHRLGEAYLRRIKGAKAENLEHAIAHLDAALKQQKNDYARQMLTSIKNLPVQHDQKFISIREKSQNKAIVTIYNELGNVYRERILGDKKKNIELAIDYYNEALKNLEYQYSPERWAIIKMNLGIAYRNRIKGENTQNLEKSIQYFNTALEQFKRLNLPEEVARTQMNLGSAYVSRLEGDISKNVETAIKCYEEALNKYKVKDFPLVWAQIQLNLGNAYDSLFYVDNKYENIETAIKCYEKALNKFKNHSYQLIAVQNGLGNAYKKLYQVDKIGKVDKFKNWKKAIDCYNVALQESKHQNDFHLLAAIQMNLGIIHSIAYFDNTWEEKVGNLQDDAIQYLKGSLEIFTCDSFPHRHVEASYILGATYQYAKQWEDAYQTYKLSIDTVEFLRGEIFSGAEAKQKLAEEWNELYQGMAEVCLQLGKDNEAIEYIERSKTRNLVELLAKQSQDLQQVGLKIEEEKRRLAAVKELQAQGGEGNTETEQLNQLRAERNNKIDEIIPLQAIRFGEIQALLDDGTVILEWYIFAECFRVFAITHDGEKPLKWESSREDLEKLNNFSKESLRTYNKDKPKWRFELASRLEELATILHIDEVLKLIPDSCETLILVPHRFLHLYPLHALPVSLNDLTPRSPSLQAKGENEEGTLLGGNGENELIPTYQQVLLDRFAGGVKYAPSSQLLKFVKESRERQNINNESQSFFALQDPNDNLLYTNIEVETIERHFQPTTVLEKGNATRDALLQKPYFDSLQTAQVLHFSCHGYFNTDSPAESAIALAGCGVSGENNSGSTPENSSYRSLANGDRIDLKKCLTLGDIFNLSLSECRLVTLSACETGRIDVNSSDEYIGLPSGFIKAGSSSVISSLWSVDDFATTLLMIRFYDIFYDNSATKSPSLSTAKVLSAAQYWLRTSTQTKLIEWTENHPKIDVEHKSTIMQYLKTWFKPDQIPLKNPESWAGFCAIGD